MSRTAINNFRSLSFGEKDFARENIPKRSLASRVLNVNGKKVASSRPQEEEISIKIKPVFLLGFAALALGFFYLYQVNDLTARGFEARSLEKKIQDLKKEAKKMEIREVELRSMYNIEKSTRELDMKSPQNITYLEMEGPLAMK